MSRNIQIDAQSIKRIENTEKNIIATRMGTENRPNTCVTGLLEKNEIRRMEQNQCLKQSDNG